MIKLFVSVFLSIYFMPLQASSTVCDIYIHGIGKDRSYFDNKPRSVKWNSFLELKKASVNLADKVLDQLYSCESDLPVVLHAHNYAATVLFYILGQGKRFSRLSPKHDFVTLYNKTTSVYSYAGAYSGTPLMDFVCSSGEFKNIRDYLGGKCILSMSTLELYHPTNTVTDPGVPFFLIYSTKSSGPFGKLLSDYRNDGVLPLSSALACDVTSDIFDSSNNCPKINSRHFKDLRHITDKGHFELVNEVLSE